MTPEAIVMAAECERLLYELEARMPQAGADERRAIAAEQKIWRDLLGRLLTPATA